MFAPKSSIDDVLIAVAQQEVPVNRTVNLGPVQVVVKHGDVARWNETQVTDTLGRLFKAGGQDPALALGLTDRQLRLWLVYAANMVLGNPGAGFDVKKALAWLVANVGKVRPVMPSPSGREFELMVLGRTGWLRAALRASAQRLTQGERDRVVALYGPPPSGAQGGQGAPLKGEVLKELLPKLYAHMADHVRQWMRPAEVPAAYQRLGDFKAIAELAQFTAWEMLQPYAAANENSPFFTGFDYFDNVFDKTATMPSDEDIVKHLMNRAHLLGEDDSAGQSIFAAAAYDATRQEDRVFLWDLLSKWIIEDKPRRAAVFFCRHIGSNSHGQPGGGVGLVTEFKTDRPQSEHRWELVEVIVHEMVHTLLHPDIKLKSGKVTRPLVILEGFVEVVTREVFNWMIDHGDEGTTARLMIGVSGDLVKPKRKVALGYAQNGVHADEIFKILGRERFLTAFMTGDTDLLGLPA
ncbi:hypothetical protein [Sphaerisporangium aureirubrum]|uniref:DUF4932 domain-containing protein n=1 Tax=Sphaerisporangium aureirubrum TaxID=1544736 RepID=A0ABW1NDA7_9ACTN